MSVGEYSLPIGAPAWLARALAYLGQIEIKGNEHNPLIIGWWEKIKTQFRDDETPWCAAFVGGVLAELGYTPQYSASARSYLKWGSELKGPRLGAVVVFWRGKQDGWSGHVGFITGRDRNGNLLVVGGNQGDRVSVASFPLSRVLGYRWPGGNAVARRTDTFGDLPVYASDGKLSQNEA